MKLEKGIAIYRDCQNKKLYHTACNNCKLHEEILKFVTICDFVSDIESALNNLEEEEKI